MGDPGVAEEAQRDGHDLLGPDEDVVEAQRCRARCGPGCSAGQAGPGRQRLEDVAVGVDDPSHDPHAGRRAAAGQAPRRPRPAGGRNVGGAGGVPWRGATSPRNGRRGREGQMSEAATAPHRAPAAAVGPTDLLAAAGAAVPERAPVEPPPRREARRLTGARRGARRRRATGPGAGSTTASVHPGRQSRRSRAPRATPRPPPAAARRRSHPLALSRGRLVSSTPAAAEGACDGGSTGRAGGDRHRRGDGNRPRHRSSLRTRGMPRRGR